MGQVRKPQWKLSPPQIWYVLTKPSCHFAFRDMGRLRKAYWVGELYCCHRPQHTNEVICCQRLALVHSESAHKRKLCTVETCSTDIRHFIIMGGNAALCDIDLPLVKCSVQ